MTKLLIYEGAMCCSTGLCGPEPNKELIELGETIKRLQQEFKGLEIIRANMSFNMNLFLEDKEVFAAIKAQGIIILPITELDGKIIAKGKYLHYAEIKEILEKV